MKTNSAVKFSQAGFLQKSSDCCKRIFDLILSFIACVIFLPIMMVVAVLIKFESPGKAIFSQKRYGRHRKIFTVYKFRTLYADQCDPSGHLQIYHNDCRVTRIGRILRHNRVDELPQLFNVLKGDMSLVGPRPHPLSLDDFYAQHIASLPERHTVKPGLTGMAQINGSCGAIRDVQQMEERVIHDLAYIQKRSFLLDLVILIKTFFVVIW